MAWGEETDENLESDHQEMTPQSKVQRKKEKPSKGERHITMNSKYI